MKKKIALIISAIFIFNAAAVLGVNFAFLSSGGGYKYAVKIIKISASAGVKTIAVNFLIADFVTNQIQNVQTAKQQNPVPQKRNTPKTDVVFVLPSFHKRILSVNSPFEKGVPEGANSPEGRGIDYSLSSMLFHGSAVLRQILHYAQNDKHGGISLLLLAALFMFWLYRLLPSIKTILKKHKHEMEEANPFRVFSFITNKNRRQL